jgi:diguanylate cyclase (GGDEF)-like protein
VTSRIRGALRSEDSAVRIGHDEFLVLLDDVSTREKALVIAQLLHGSPRSPYEISDYQRSKAVSFAVSFGSNAFGNRDEIVVAADEAMYEAKRHA